jgi:hypothetical protein
MMMTRQRRSKVVIIIANKRNTPRHVCRQKGATELLQKTSVSLEILSMIQIQAIRQPAVFATTTQKVFGQNIDLNFNRFPDVTRSHQEFERVGTA